MQQGYLYLAAVIDWYSRYVLSWELSNTMESSFCVVALLEALNRYGDPEIFNTIKDRSTPVKITRRFCLTRKSLLAWMVVVVL